MRLIDADELPEVNTIERIEGEREVFVNSWIPASAIWKAPTVEAIPIEWIEKRIADQNAELRELKRRGGGQIVKWYEWELNGLRTMLEDWGKENETD